MRGLFTYSHYPQREKKYQKKRKDYYYSFNLSNPEGTNHLLIKEDILTCYEQLKKQKKRKYMVNL